MATKAKTKPKKKEPQNIEAARAYQGRVTDFDISSQRFRAMLLRHDAPRGQRITNVDQLTESIEWRAQPGNPVLEGTLQVRPPEVGPRFSLHDGHVLKLDVYWGGRWREVWRMGLYDGQTALDGSRTFEMYDDGRRLQDSEDYWHFTKSKAKGKPKGWKAHEIVREVARRYRIPVGKIAEGTHYITDISGKMSPMQVLQRAYAIERRATGKRFVIRWHNGKLNILPMRRNPLMYVLGDLIESADVGREARDEKFATAVTVRATAKGKKRKREKIVYRHADEKAIAREGFVHKVIDGADVKDLTDAARKAKRYLLKHARRKRTIAGIEHRGIAFLRRGDAIQVHLPEQHLTGRLGIAFISSGSWRLAGGDFTMSLDVTVDDPYKSAKNKRKDQDKKTRAKKRQARARK